MATIIHTETKKTRTFKSTPIKVASNEPTVKRTKINNEKSTKRN